MTIALVLTSEATWNVPDAIAAPVLALLLACYSLGAHASLRTAATGLVLVLAPLLAFALWQDKGLDDFLFLGTIFAGIWASGRLVRSRRGLAAQLADRAVLLEHERDQQAILAAAAERNRIARELHDVVAHCVNVMVLQAGAERRVLGNGRPETVETLQAIEHTGRQALGELRRLLGIVRAEGEDPALEPQPTLAELHTLVEHARRAGLDAKLRVEGEPRPLPPGLELSGFRIVQEAVTNTLKHAAATSATVTVRYRPGALELEITDDGAGVPDHDKTGGGHGLIGMHERVAIFDGTLDAGPRAGGGFRVSVRLPVERDHA
ncbi:MAG TPA: sensor histidine kinase [Solirubrobacteraceae bacterium]|nr:sensor histidine kinase [Solirubrobacteraceae bacterium]